MRALHQAPDENIGLPHHLCFEEDVAPLSTGESVELTFDLRPTSNLFDEGHRIRVTVTCADSGTFNTPVLDPPPTVTVYRNAEHDSYVELPVIP